MNVTLTDRYGQRTIVLSCLRHERGTSTKHRCHRHKLTLSPIRALSHKYATIPATIDPSVPDKRTVFILTTTILFRILDFLLNETVFLFESTKRLFLKQNHHYEEFSGVPFKRNKATTPIIFLNSQKRSSYFSEKFLYSPPTPTIFWFFAILIEDLSFVSLMKLHILGNISLSFL